MAIAFDNFSGGGTFNSNHSSQTVAHTVSGSDRALIVAVSSCCSPGADRITTMTYNGSALTRLSTGNMQSNTPLSLWGMVNPDTGTNNLVINYSVSFAYSWVAIASYTGVSQTGFPDAIGTFTNSGGVNRTSQTNSITPTVDNCWAVMGCYAEGGQSAGTGTTLRGVGLVRVSILDSGGPISPAALTELRQNHTSAPTANAIISMAPAASGGGVTPPIHLAPVGL